MAINKKDQKRALRRKLRVSNRLKRGTQEMPRVAVFKSLKHICAQIIDDTKGITLVSASSMQEEVVCTKKEMAQLVGLRLAKKALEIGIERAFFDRGNAKYTGRISALADALRSGGIHI